MQKLAESERGRYVSFSVNNMQRETDLSKHRPLVGLIVDCTDTYGRSLFRGVMRYANLQRRWLLFKDYRHISKLDGQWPPLDGAVIGGTPKEVFDQAQKTTSNIVQCSGGGDPTVCPVVSIDNYLVGQLGADHLMECGLEHFGFYGIDQYRVADLRLKGFKEKLSQKGHECQECPLSRPDTNAVVSHQHRKQLIDWLKKLPKPIGIICFDDTVASDLAEACLETQLQVPDEVSILGVNNDDLLCDSAWPPLSSVETDYSRVGFAAARLLDRMLEGQKVLESERFTQLPPLRVIQRQSTNLLNIRDRNLADAVRFIREHACDPCSVSDILKIIPVGRRWLEREFVSQLGRTLHDEITQNRIKTACRLILESDLNINEVATRCGYASIKSFYNAFSKLMHITPAEYRRQAKAGAGK